MPKWLIIVLMLLSPFIIWAFWIEPSRTTYPEIEIADIEALSPLSGMKMVLISDPHIGSPHMSLERLESIVARANSYEADMIMLLGDYVVEGMIGGESVPPEHIFTILNRLHAPLGVYAVMGNHDWWYGYDRIVAEFRRSAPNITLLEDQAERITYDGQTFMLLGISDFYEGPHDYHAALEKAQGLPIIALTHTPDIFPELPKQIALTFAGHTHGGQIYIPLLGRPIVPSRYGQRYVMGLVEEQGHHLFVSAGIGTTIIGMRFLTPPEVNIVTLR